MPSPQSSIDASWSTASPYLEQVPAQHCHWLSDPASLTDKLVARAAGDFKVEVLNQSIAQPLLSETQALGLARDDTALVREVALLGQSEPWVYARTVIPQSSLDGSLGELRELGNRSLGSAIFADPSLQRGALEIARIEPDYIPAYGLLIGVSPTWGRRSVFTLKGQSLLVTEVFLESLWNN